MEEYESTFYKKLIENPFVYHYTSIEAIFSILEEYRKNERGALPFWAGCVYKTNDLREMELGYDTLKSILPKFEKSIANSIRLSDVYRNEEYEKQCKELSFQKPIDGMVEMSSIPYTISFSCKRDFLPMWSMYGDNKKGVCLKFKLSKLIDSLRGNLQLCFVYYEGEKDNIIEDYLLPTLYEFDAKRFSKKMSINDKISELSVLCDCMSPFVKMKDWGYEEEFRIVYHEHYGPKFEDQFLRGLQLMPSKIKVADHIVLPVSAESLEEIIIGPLARYEVLNHVLHNELKECHLDSVSILPSSIQLSR